MPKKGSSFWIFFFAYLIYAAAVINIAFDLYGRTTWFVPQDIGELTGEVALVLMGCLAQTIGDSVRKLEKQVSEHSVKSS